MLQIVKKCHTVTLYLLDYISRVLQPIMTSISEQFAIETHSFEFCRSTLHLYVNECFEDKS